MSDATATANSELQKHDLAPNGHSDLAEEAANLKVSEGPETNGKAEAEDDDDDEEEEAVAGAGAGANGAAKKKKKKKKSKKKKAAAVPTVQSSPPRVPVSVFFPSGEYPLGECSDYLGNNSWRTTSEEKRHLEQLAAQEDPLSPDNYNAIRRAAEVHRQVRRYARETIKPGMKMIDIAELIEDGTRALVEAEGMQRGIGFPTGVSINNCAAHYTPNFGDTRVLQNGDILKVDFGVQVNGRILDSAFTLNFNENYDNLLKAVRSATNAGVREAGIDARVADLGAIIQETMESYEVEVDGKTHKVKAIQNLTGHTILPYQIHGHKTVPIVAGTDETAIMEEGDYFAIETFGSTGRGKVHDDGETSHYAKNPNEGMYKPLALQGAKDLWKVINREFGTLPFCRRYLDYAGQKPPSYYPHLSYLCSKGYVMGYPPLSDVVGSMTAQFEHTILLRPTCKEVVSRGDDY